MNALCISGELQIGAIDCGSSEFFFRGVLTFYVGSRHAHG